MFHCFLFIFSFFFQIKKWDPNIEQSIHLVSVSVIYHIFFTFESCNNFEVESRTTFNTYEFKNMSFEVNQISKMIFNCLNKYCRIFIFLFADCQLLRNLAMFVLSRRCQQT